MRTTDSDTPAVPTLQASKGDLSLQYTICVRHTTVTHTIERALRSTVAKEAQHLALDLCSKGIIMGTRTLDLARIWI